jgi:hypothetical protein
MNEKLETAIQTWRQKHNVRDDDPLMAFVEAIVIYLEHQPPIPEKTEADRVHIIELSSSTVERVENSTQQMLKEMNDLGKTLRAAEACERRRPKPSIAASLITGAVLLALGILLGRYL